MGRGTNRGVQVLSQSRGAATAIEREHLQLARGATVLRTTRLRGDGSRALMYETACLALDRLPGLENAEFGNYHILALARVCGVQLGPTQERVIRTPASAEVALHLGVGEEAELLALDRTIFARSGEPIEWRVAFCNLGPAEIE